MPPHKKPLLVGKPLLYVVSIFSSLGVFVMGFDQGVLSGICVQPHFKDYFNQPSRAELGTIVAILEIGAMMSTMFVGVIADTFGRRATIFYGAIIFTIGGAIQTFTIGFYSMLLGRIVSGLGVGLLSTIVPVYQSEISPPHNRGKLACIEFSGNIIGYASSCWVDYACSFIPNDYAWRTPLFIQVVTGSFLALGTMVICESPRWLLDVDRDEEGLRVIANLHGKGNLHHHRARREFCEIKENVLIIRESSERSFADLLRKYRLRCFIGMSSQAFAQMNGINVISLYAPMVFEQAGWVGRDAVLMTAINAGVYVMSTVPPWYLIDRSGRRKILLSGGVVMAIALALISYFMYLDLSYTPQAVVGLVIIFNAGMLCAASNAYITAFGASWGPVPWLLAPEIFPLSVRAKGASLATATNWFFNFLVGEQTPVLQQILTWRLFLLHSTACMVSVVVVYLVYPETKGVSLEDMDILFGDEPLRPLGGDTASIAESATSALEAAQRPLLEEVDGTVHEAVSRKPPSYGATAFA